MRYLTLGNLAWAVAYVASMAVLVYWLAQARGWALDELGTPAARAQWQAWRNDAAQDTVHSEGAVDRRVPKSSEPPALIILRDSFPGVLVTCLALGSFLFCFLMVAARGTFRTAGRLWPGREGVITTVPRRPADWSEATSSETAVTSVPGTPVGR